MKATKLEIEKFTAFENCSLEFSTGLNVMIGENGTGKSHVLKLLYALLRAGEAERVGDRLMGLFRPDAMRRLVRRTVGRSKAKVTLTTRPPQPKARKLRCGFELTTQDRLSPFYDEPLDMKALFLPAREVLSIAEGFVAAYENRELAFDETYRDLCVALSAAPLRGPRGAKAAELVDPLLRVLGGRVVFESGRYYLASAEGKLEAHLLAEGLRKVATLAHLIANGSLLKNGVLLWDEPEANMNPRLTVVLASALATLADEGVQVVLATHDYLLAHELSLRAEHGVSKSGIQFFALYREARDEPAQIESGNTLAQINHNSILEEFVAHYDREAELTQAQARRAKR
jgi:energy-coupling factor transporter ATP-binding protein EcfA2